MAYTITRGVSAKPVKAVCYGVEGVGKTTFAGAWPNAVFIDVEDGSGHYDVARLPRPTEWLGLLAEIEAAAKMPEIGTLVVDTADAAEALCIAHVLTVKKWKGIEDAGYGKGYTYLAEEFSKLTSALDKVAGSGKNVLLLAHAQIRKFEQPDEMGAYDRWELKLQKKDAPIIKEWCDLLLFANYKNDMMKDEQTKKYKATGGKRRVMYATHTAAYDAKNRLGLADELPFEFQAIADKVVDGSKPKAKSKMPVTPEDEAEAQAVAEAAANATETPEVQVSDLKFEEVTEPEFAQLHQLMADYQISEVQLRDAVASRKNNHYTEETPISEYSVDFVKNTLLKHWEKIVATIEDRGDVYKIPF